MLDRCQLCLVGCKVIQFFCILFFFSLVFLFIRKYNTGMREIRNCKPHTGQWTGRADTLEQESLFFQRQKQHLIRNNVKDTRIQMSSMTTQVMQLTVCLSPLGLLLIDWFNLYLEAPSLVWNLLRVDLGSSSLYRSR